MNGETAIVYLVDDDPSILRALARLLRAGGHQVSTFRSPRDFLAQHDAAAAGCVVLDLAMPGLSGLELQTALAAAGCQRPIVFLSGHGDVPSSVRAMKAGAVDFLTKPVSERDLLGAIERAIERDRTMRHARAELQAIGERLNTLTPRERQVLQHVVSGQLNKQIAADLGTVEKTVKVHRSRVMEKMGVRSLADLVRMAERLGIAAADQDSPDRLPH
ncbi:MAG TPA: response regulator [Candidatus Acidoferrum sp.]|nr:response regulator [Candidatus Acidoferrum sp.]